MQRKFTAISPLALLTVAACGGSETSNGGGYQSISFSGNVVKGPLEGAWVFFDLNDNGNWDPGTDSARVQTDAEGAYSLAEVSITAGATPTIVAYSDGTALDRSSGNLLSAGSMLSAPSGASVVTPMTTIAVEAGLSPSDVAAALGLAGIDLLTYNPYDDPSSATALAVEQTAHQVMNTINALKVSGEEAGLTAEAALTKSLEAFGTVITNAKSAGDQISLDDSSGTSNFGLASLATEFTDTIALAVASDFEFAPADEQALAIARIAAKDKVDAVKTSILDGVTTVNSLVAESTTLEGDTSAFFSVGTKLAEQVADAVSSGDAGKITVDDPLTAKNIGLNKSATKIEISGPDDAVSGITIGSDGAVSISENVSGGNLIGTLSADDTGNLTFEIIGESDTNDLFEIVVNADGSKLMLTSDASFDHEVAKTVKLAIKVSDAAGKSYTENFEFSIGDVDEDPTVGQDEVDVDQGKTLSVALSIADPEGRSISVALASDSELFEIVDGVLKTTRAVSQDDVDGGDVDLALALTDAVSGKTTNTMVTISFVNVNDDPIFTTSSIDVATEGKSYAQAIVASDPDGDDITFALVSSPDWLTIDKDGNLSGTVPSDDTKIASTGTITIKATDQDGGETVKDYVLEFINTNDAPEFTVDSISAYIVETDDVVGVDTARESDNLSGTIAFNDIDAGDDASNLTLTLNDAGSAGSDGRFAVTGDFGTLIFDPSDNTYEYQVDVDKVEPLYKQTAQDEFTFKLLDDEGASDTLKIVVNLQGADDKPRLAAESEQDFVTLGNNQTGTVLGEVNVYDGSQYAGFALAAASSGRNDNEKFEVAEKATQLKLKDGVTTDFSSQEQYVVELYAQDYDVDGKAVEGTRSDVSQSFTIKINKTDAAPQIVSVETDYDGSALRVGEQLVFEVTLSETVVAGGESEMSLSNGASVTLSVGSSAGQVLTGTYIVQESDTDAASNSPLQVASINSGSVADTTGNALIAQSSPLDLNGVEIDANSPNAVLLGTADNPHTYDASTGKLTLVGADLVTILNGSLRDVTDIVDWSKLTWNIDAEQSVTRTFASDDVGSAIVNLDGTEVVVTLTSEATTELHSLAGFGGNPTSGGISDAIAVANGFLRDAAGNTSSEASTAASEIKLTDAIAPTLSGIEINGLFSSSDGTDRAAGDSFIIGDTLTIRATLDEGSELASAAQMNITLTLSNKEQLKLTRPEDASGSDMVFSAEYVITSGDIDVADFAIDTLAITGISDVSGNMLSDDNIDLNSVPITYTGDATSNGISIDANAPTATIAVDDNSAHTYNAVTGVFLLQGTGLTSLRKSQDDNDVSDVLDFTKITWNIDAEGTTTRAFSASDIETAVVNSSVELAITLNAAARTSLQTLNGFGGSELTGGNLDALNIQGGFLIDAAGNSSVGTTAVTQEISMTDGVAPILHTLDYVGDPDSRVGTGDVLEFLAVFTDTKPESGAELAADAEMVLTLSNGVSVTLRHSDTLGEELQLKGSYVVAEEDDTFGGDGAETKLSVASFDASDVRDLSGNLAVSDNSNAALKNLSNGVIVDTIVPELDQVLFITQENALKFVFDELLSESSLKGAIDDLELLDNVANVSEVSNTSTTITIGIEPSVTFSQGDEIDLGSDFSVEDLAGNTLEIAAIVVDDIV
jgi:hypothetical protein